MVDHEARIGMLLAGEQVGAGHLRIGELAEEAIGAVLAVKPGTGGQREVAEGDVRCEGDMSVRKMGGLMGFEFHLHAVETCALPHPDFGDTVGEVAALTDMRFDERRGGAGATSITLRVAMVRGAALVEMKTSSTGVSMLPESVRRAPPVAKAAFICWTGSSAGACASTVPFANRECAAS